MPPLLPPVPTGSFMTVGVVDDDASLIECYLDLICPFSAKMFITLYDEVVPNLVKNNKQNISIRIHHVIQPWHPQSTMVHETALAVKKILGIEMYLSYIRGVYEQFTDDEHQKFSDADTWNKTRLEIYDELLQVCLPSQEIKDKVKALLVPPLIPAEAAAAGNSGNAMTQDLKWACKHHRTRGVHVTPTVFVNGIEASQVSSGWKLTDWNDFFKEFE